MRSAGIESSYESHYFSHYECGRSFSNNQKLYSPRAKAMDVGKKLAKQLIRLLNFGLYLGHF